MIAKPINLQDGFLNQVRKENAQVIVFLVNGFQLRGLVRGFDNFTLVLENENKPHLVYKHAISTIVPARAVTISPAEDKEEAPVAEE